MRRSAQMRRAVAIAAPPACLLIFAVCVAPASAQVPTPTPTPTPTATPSPTATPPPAPQLVPGARVRAPAAVAEGGRLAVAVTGLRRPVRVQVRTKSGWRARGRAITRAGASAGFRVALTAARLRVRGLGADGNFSHAVTVTVRPLTLAAVGDINLGDGPGRQIALRGAEYPWASVGPALRAADIAFGNLECAVSRGGTPQQKQYVFRGSPSSLAAMRRVGGLDVVNLANNHSGDYGDRALLDTLHGLRRTGIAAVGAGASEAAAYRPRIVTALGLRVAFVGFSSILPFEFRAIGASPGSAWAFPGRIRAGIAKARRHADVVIATFHWGEELHTTETALQRQLAHVALDAGATAVIGAHPHVLEPIRRTGRRLVAYSLGNFVFSASSGATASTGILTLDLAAGRVRGAHLRRATIRAARPILTN